MNLIAGAGIKRISLEATVIRANGTVEPLGEIAVWHRNPLRRAWTRVTRLFTRCGTITKG